jgi:hypothetical protein
MSTAKRGPGFRRPCGTLDLAENLGRSYSERPRSLLPTQGSYDDLQALFLMRLFRLQAARRPRSGLSIGTPLEADRSGALVHLCVTVRRWAWGRGRNALLERLSAGLMSDNRIPLTSSPCSSGNGDSTFLGEWRNAP